MPFLPPSQQRQSTEGNLPLGFMTHVTCRLTAKNWDHLQNGTLAVESMSVCRSVYMSVCLSRCQQWRVDCCHCAMMPWRWVTCLSLTLTLISLLMPSAALLARSVISLCMLDSFTVCMVSHTHARTHTHTFSGPLSRTTQVSQYQKGKTNLDFTEARNSEWQWHQLGHMQVCTSLQTDNHAHNPPPSEWSQ